MGSGGSKKRKNAIQQEAPKPSNLAEIESPNRSPPQSPQLPAISPRRPSIHSRPRSLHRQTLSKRNSTNLSNGIEDPGPSRKLDNNSTGENDDDVSLPSIDNPINKPKLPSPTSASPVLRPQPINRSGLVSDSLSEYSKHSNQQVGRCSHCPHCQRTKSDHRILSLPKPKWLTKKPGINQLQIVMDEYDVEAIKKKIISENGHLPGSYDYRPHLTIEQDDNYDQTKENYYTQPFVAKIKPRIAAMGTPFPNYELLQRREQRINKPYTLPLFDY